MRIAFIGVSHWHTPYYIGPVAADDSLKIVGVADPSSASTERWADELGTKAFADYRDMCETTRPDLVFALGRHSDMAAAAEYLVDSGIPFGMEKPCGTSVEQLEWLTSLVTAKDAFGSVAFVHRYGRLRELIATHSPDKDLIYGSFRTFSGLPERYHEYGCDWNLDPVLAGGGCTLNLSVHFFDLLRVLAPSAPWTVTSASMSNASSGISVEDYSATLLHSEGRRAVVETGYTFPGLAGTMKNLDLSFSLRVGDDYYRSFGKDQIFVRLASGEEREFKAGTGNGPFYPLFVRDTISRVMLGRQPTAGMADMLEAARLAKAAYRSAGYTNLMVPSVPIAALQH